MTAEELINLLDKAIDLLDKKSEEEINKHKEWLKRRRVSLHDKESLIEYK